MFRADLLLVSQKHKGGGMTFTMYDLCSLENMSQSIPFTLTTHDQHLSLLRKNEVEGRRKCLPQFLYRNKHLTLTLCPLFSNSHRSHQRNVKIGLKSTFAIELGENSIHGQERLRSFFQYTKEISVEGHTVVFCSVTSNPLQPHGLLSTSFLCPWNCPGKSTGVG